MEFKDKVIMARAKLNISQKQLGLILHVTLGTISRWETGKVQPTKKAQLVFEEFCKEKNINFTGEKSL